MIQYYFTDQSKRKFPYWDGPKLFDFSLQILVTIKSITYSVGANCRRVNSVHVPVYVLNDPFMESGFKYNDCDLLV